MADENKDRKPQNNAASEGGRKLPIKMIAIILVMMIAEAGVIVGAVMFLGQPSPVQGVALDSDPSADLEKMHEVPILQDKFANNSTGRLWYWDTEVLVKCKQKHLAAVQSELEDRAAEIRTGIGAVLAGAQHSYFNEPGRETLSRQLLEYLRGVFGQDAEGEERIADVLIPKCIGFPADY